MRPKAPEEKEETLGEEPRRQKEPGGSAASNRTPAASRPPRQDKGGWNWEKKFGAGGRIPPLRSRGEVITATGRDRLAGVEKQTSPHANSRGHPGPRRAPGSCANTASPKAAGGAMAEHGGEGPAAGAPGWRSLCRSRRAP